MLYSQLFTKTSKDIPADEVSKNGKLLIQAGFVDKTMAGAYGFLPLGLRVINKIENLIRKHMNKIGGQEILMNSLHPKEPWQKTGRWDTVDVLFKLNSQTKTEYALACSHEEQVTPIAKKFISSHKDLPIFDPEAGVWPLSIYQIQTKFRDELRAKSGLLRGREFRMKDMYDFHQTQESLEKYYEYVKQAYFDFYEEIELKVYAVKASGGMFTENISHEFQTPCEAGEDWIMVSKSTGFSFNEEIMDELKQKGENIPGDLERIKVAEVGNIFQLGTKYTEAFNLKYTNENNEQKYPIMGCHGIGSSRCMAAVAENHSDDKGLIWPKLIAPFEIHLITQLNQKSLDQDQKIIDLAKKIYNVEISKVGDIEIKSGEVLWDNRDKISIGNKLKDADLIGCPVQIVISERSLESGGVEVRDRSIGESKIVSL